MVIQALARCGVYQRDIRVVKVGVPTLAVIRALAANLTAKQQTDLLTRLDAYVADERGWHPEVTALADLATVETRYKPSGRQWAVRLLAEVQEKTVANVYRTDLRWTPRPARGWSQSSDGLSSSHPCRKPAPRVRIGLMSFILFIAGQGKPASLEALGVASGSPYNDVFDECLEHGLLVGHVVQLRDGPQGALGDRQPGDHVGERGRVLDLGREAEPDLGLGDASVAVSRPIHSGNLRDQVSAPIYIAEYDEEHLTEL